MRSSLRFVGPMSHWSDLMPRQPFEKGVRSSLLRKDLVGYHHFSNKTKLRSLRDDRGDGL